MEPATLPASPFARCGFLREGSCLRNEHGKLEHARKAAWEDPGSRGTEDDVNKVTFTKTEDERVPIMLRGVSFAFLRAYCDFLKQTGKQHANSGQIVNGIHTTSSATDWQEFDVRKDAHCVKSACVKSGLSFVETCMDDGVTHNSDGRPFFGPINTFVSYTWRGEGISFVSMVGALETTLRREYGPSAFDDFYFFVDIFACCQHRNEAVPRDQCPNFIDVSKFETIIVECERLVFYCFPVTNPLALERVWCLYEIMKAKSCGIRFSVALSEGDEQNFVEALVNDSDLMNSMFGDIDARNAEATNPEDKSRIFLQIQESVGFDELNLMVKSEMRTWIVETCSRVATLRSDEPSVLDGIASGFVTMGLLQRACDLYSQALELVIASPRGPDHPDVARMLNKLGEAEEKQANYTAARKCFDRALKIFAKSSGWGHQDVATSRRKLGDVETHLGNYSAAKEHFEQALAVYFETLGPDHPDVARTHGNLGHIAEKLGDYDTAKAHYHKTLLIRERTLDRNHVFIAMAHNNLGCVARETKAFADAKFHFGVDLRISTEALGPDHPDVAWTQGDIASTLGFEALSQGNTENAKVHLTRSLPYYEKVAVLSSDPHVVHIKEVLKELGMGSGSGTSIAEAEESGSR